MNSMGELYDAAGACFCRIRCTSLDNMAAANQHEYRWPTRVALQLRRQGFTSGFHFYTHLRSLSSPRFRNTLPAASHFWRLSVESVASGNFSGLYPCFCLCFCVPSPSLPAKYGAENCGYCEGVPAIPSIRSKPVVEIGSASCYFFLLPRTTDRTFSCDHL